MIKYLYRTLAHIFFHHTNLFNTLEEKFKICERLTLYCNKFKILQSKEIIVFVYEKNRMLLFLIIFIYPFNLFITFYKLSIIRRIKIMM
jgi:hypothetical protein